MSIYDKTLVEAVEALAEKQKREAEKTVEFHISVPEDTLFRCFHILEMWMDDHPNDRIIVDRELTTNGYRHKMFIDTCGSKE